MCAQIIGFCNSDSFASYPLIQKENCIEIGLISILNHSEAKIAGHHDANRDNVGSRGKSSFHRGAALPWC